MQGFDRFFQAATGSRPYGFQARIARDGLPSAVETPTGTGKTGIILAWLWRRLHADPGATPRRLVYALPSRSLTEHVAGEVTRWLANLGLDDLVALYVPAGVSAQSQRRWRLDMHKPAIVISTADTLVSKALNRGYGLGTARTPSTSRSPPTARTG
jgi:CRISPR-associated endonuclease/helicase Cas3